MSRPETTSGGPLKYRAAALAFGWVALLAVIAAFLGHEDLVSTFNSDIYYLPMLVKDICEMGGSLGEWRLPPAPYFFPDLVLYLPLHLAVRNPITALALAGAVHYILFVGGWFAVAGRFAKDERARFASQAAVLFMGSLGMVLGSLMHVAYWSTQITMHFGVMTAAPWFLLLAHISVSSTRARARLFSVLGMFLMASGLAASDMLSLTQVLLPSAAALLLMFLTGKARWQDAAAACAAIAAGTLLGVCMPLWLGKASLSGYIQPDLIHSADAARAFIRWATGFLRTQTAAAVIGAVMLVINVLVVMFGLARASRAKPIDPGLLHVSSFVAFAVPINVIAVLVMGNFFSSADARYALSFMFYPLFSAPVLLGGIRIPGNRARLLVPGCIIMFAAALAMNSGSLGKTGRFAHYAGHYPDWVAWVDQETARRGITDGIGSYWDAKELMLLSRKGVKLSQSTTYMVPYNWISNTKWFDRITPRFFLCSTDPRDTDRVQEREVIGKFGSPAERLTFQRRSLLIYPEGSLLGKWYRDHPMRREFSAPGETAVFKASELPGDIGEDHGAARVAEPPAREGSLTLGPYIMMPKGSYRAVIRYSSEPGPTHLTSGYWQLRRVARTEPRLLREGQLDPSRQEELVAFDLQKRSAVELLTSYTGSGKLVVMEISFERIR